MKLAFLFIGCISFSSQQFAQDPREISQARDLVKQNRSDTGYIQALIKISRYLVNKPGEATIDLDSAIQFGQQALIMSRELGYPAGEVLSNLVLSQSFDEKKMPNEGMQHARLATEVMDRHHIIPGSGDAYAALARHYSAFDDSTLPERIHLFEIARDRYHRSGELTNEINTLKELGDLRVQQKRYPESLVHLHAARTLAEQYHQGDLIGIYDLLGIANSQTGNYGEAIRYGLLALKTAESMNDSGQLVTIYNRLGVTYNELKDYEKALSHFRLAWTLAEQKKDSPTAVLISGNVVNALLSLQMPGEALAVLQDIEKRYKLTNSPATMYRKYLAAYTLLGKYEEAATYFNKLITERKKIPPGSFSRTHINRAMINYLLATHKYKEAYPYLQENDSLQRKANAALGLVFNHLAWFKADSAMGKLNSAITHLQQHKKLNDSLFNIEKAGLAQRLQVEFETSKKDAELLHRQIELQGQQKLLKEEKNSRKLIIAAAVLLLLLSALLYNRYALKKKHVEALTVHQLEIDTKNTSLEKLIKEKEWLVKEMHHRVKNNLQTVISLLSAQAQYLTDTAVKSAIKDSEQRLFAMALMHQKLTYDESNTIIAIRPYFEDLIRYLESGFEESRSVTILLEVDDIYLEIAQAVPLSLIVNEAVVNAMKYAFRDKQSGTIWIQLQQVGHNVLQLTVEDNGVGFPANFDPATHKSLGMALIHGFSKQLGATLRIENEDGCRISVALKINEPAYVG